MMLPYYLQALHDAESILADDYRKVAGAHATVADVAFGSLAFSRQNEEQALALGEIISLRYPGTDDAAEAMALPDRLLPTAFVSTRSGPLGLLRDLADLQQLTTFIGTTWELMGQVAAAQRDHDLIAPAERCAGELTAQSDWLRTRMRTEAAQALLVAGP